MANPEWDNYNPSKCQRCGGSGNEPTIAPQAGSPTALSEERVHGVTWIVFDVKKEHVMLERCPKKAKVLGVGEWFVPGGKIEGDEIPADACRREIGEEWPWVKVLALEPLPIVEGSRVGGDQRGVFLMRPFIAHLQGPIKDVSDDGVELRWVPIAEALASPVPQVRMMVAAALAPDASPLEQSEKPSNV